MNHDSYNRVRQAPTRSAKSSANYYDNQGFRVRRVAEKTDVSGVTWPRNQFYSPKIATLRFREEPSLNGKFIRLLDKTEKLLILQKGKEEIIEGVNGNWVKVQTEKYEIGWRFMHFLKR
jgi:hypothetical protein